MNDGLRQLLQVISDLVPRSYVVGGAIRDRLLGLRPRVDLDVAVKGNGLEIAELAHFHSGVAATVVPLHPTHGVARIVLRDEHPAIIDISPLKGESIEEDLTRRDFTINAMAVALNDYLETDLERMIDPCGGLLDLQKRIVNVCSSRAFLDDPLRVLRAFRFSALLGFEIGSDTLTLISQHMQGLAGVAGERVRDELVGILETDASFATLKGMDAIGILELLFPELRPMKGCLQNEYHHLDVWDHSLETIRILETMFHRSPPCFGDLHDSVEGYLNESLVPCRPRRALLKLAALFHDSGKPQARFVDAQRRVRFFGHERYSTEIFEKAGGRLRLAAREMRTIVEWISGHMRSMIFTGDTVSTRAVGRLCRQYGREVQGLLVLFLADLAASRGPARPPGSQERACEAVKDGLQICADLEKTPFVPLLKGRDLMTLFGLEPGPQLGTILKQLADLQSSGDINTREEAISEARKILGLQI
jgi:poly(A) polymerase